MNNTYKVQHYHRLFFVTYRCDLYSDSYTAGLTQRCIKELVFIDGSYIHIELCLSLSSQLPNKRFGMWFGSKVLNSAWQQLS